MKQIYFAVYDSAAAYFLNPFPSPTEEAAHREFAKAVLNPETPIHHNPEHFKLFRLGSWNNNTGQFDDEDNKLVADALAVVAQSKREIPQDEELGE